MGFIEIGRLWFLSIIDFRSSILGLDLVFLRIGSNGLGFSFFIDHRLSIIDFRIGFGFSWIVCLCLLSYGSVALTIQIYTPHFIRGNIWNDSFWKSVYGMRECRGKYVYVVKRAYFLTKNWSPVVYTFSTTDPLSFPLDDLEIRFGWSKTIT